MLPEDVQQEIAPFAYEIAAHEENAHRTGTPGTPRARVREVRKCRARGDDRDRIRRDSVIANQRILGPLRPRRNRARPPHDCAVDEQLGTLDPTVLLLVPVPGPELVVVQRSRVQRQHRRNRAHVVQRQQANHRRVNEERVKRSPPMRAGNLAPRTDVSSQRIALAEQRDASEPFVVEGDLEPFALDVATLREGLPKAHAVRDVTKCLFEDKSDARLHVGRVESTAVTARINAHGQVRKQPAVDETPACGLAGEREIPIHETQAAVLLALSNVGD